MSFNLYKYLPLAVAVMIPVWSQEPVSPFPVEDKAQLFVDQVLVREMQGISFTLHPAREHPENPLVKSDQPWEGWRTHRGMGLCWRGNLPQYASSLASCPLLKRTPYFLKPLVAIN